MIRQVKKNIRCRVHVKMIGYDKSGECLFDKKIKTNSVSIS